MKRLLLLMLLGCFMMSCTSNGGSGSPTAAPTTFGTGKTLVISNDDGLEGDRFTVNKMYFETSPEAHTLVIMTDKQTFRSKPIELHENLDKLKDLINKVATVYCLKPVNNSNVCGMLSLSPL